MSFINEIKNEIFERAPKHDLFEYRTYGEGVAKESRAIDLDVYIGSLGESQLKEFVSGVFLTSAQSSISIKGEGSGYHIEFVFANMKNAQAFCEILASYEILPKLINRKGNPVIYIKSSDCICNLLALIGATKSLLALSNEIATRSVRNSANRKANCDTYNIEKQIEAAKQQVAAVLLLQNSGRLGR